MSSRRDDLIALVYVLIYMMDQKRLSFIDRVLKVDKDQQFDIVKAEKFRMETKDLCGANEEESRAFHISQFVQEIMDYKFEETPDYNKLRFLLEKVLLDKRIIPNKKYDWISEQEQLLRAR